MSKPAPTRTRQAQRERELEAAAAARRARMLDPHLADFARSAQRLRDVAAPSIPAQHGPCGPCTRRSSACHVPQACAVAAPPTTTAHRRARRHTPLALAAAACGVAGVLTVLTLAAMPSLAGWISAALRGGSA